MRRSILIAAMAISGCSSVQVIEPSSAPTSSAWAAKTLVSRDDFAKTVKVTGSPYKGNRNVSLWLVSSTSQRDSVTAIALTIQSTSKDWTFPDYALDHDGQQFPLSRIDAKVGYCSAYLGCDLRETAQASVTRDYLLQAIDKGGIVWKVYGKYAHEPINLPAEYIEGFLASIPAR